MKKIIFISILATSFLFCRELSAQQQEYPKLEKLKISDKNLRLEIEIEDLNWLKTIRKDSLMKWLCSDIINMAKKYGESKPPLQFIYEYRSINEAERFVKIDSSNVEAERFESTSLNAVKYSYYKYKIQLNLGKQNNFSNTENKNIKKRAKAESRSNPSKQIERSKNVVSTQTSLTKTNKPNFNIGIGKAKAGKISLMVRDEKSLNLYLQSNLDSLLNKMVDSLNSLKWPKRLARSVEMGGFSAPNKDSITSVYSKPFMDESFITFKQLQRDYFYLSEGLGISNIRGEWVPNFQVKLMYGFDNKNGRTKELGLSIDNFACMNPSNAYRPNLNSFLNISYEEYFPILPNYRPRLGFSLGYLISRQGDFFLKNTYKFGISFPINSKTTVTYAGYGNPKNNKDGIYELGLLFWFP